MNRHENALRLLESAFLARMLGSNETSYIGEDACDGGQQRADTSERVGPLSFQDKICVATPTGRSSGRLSRRMDQDHRCDTDQRRPEAVGTSHARGRVGRHDLANYPQSNSMRMAARCSFTEGADNLACRAST